jgi:membrane protein
MSDDPRNVERSATWWQLAKQSFSAWSEDYASSMGAALAYYTLFSLAPLLLLVISVAGLVFGADAAQGQVVAQLGGLLGKEGATAVEGLLKSASHPGKSLMASIVSIVTLIIGATSTFAELQSDLDRIWRAPAAAKPAGIWGLVRTRLLSFGLIVSIGFLLLVSLVVSAGLAAFGKWYGAWLPGWVITLEIVNQAVSLAFVTALFALMYRILPSVRVAWSDVWRGAFATAVLFTVGKFLIGLYVGKAGVASGFGAAGSIVVLLVWVFYSAQIFLLGAEFTWLYAHSHGSKAAEAPAAPAPSRAAPAAAVPAAAAAMTARKALPPAPPGAGARDFATAGLVWIGFGAVRSLLRGVSRKTVGS